MPWLSVTTKDGVLITRLDLNNWDLNRRLPSLDLLEEIRGAKEDALSVESEEEENT